ELPWHRRSGLGHYPGAAHLARAAATTVAGSPQRADRVVPDRHDARVCGPAQPDLARPVAVATVAPPNSHTIRERAASRCPRVTTTVPEHRTGLTKKSEFKENPSRRTTKFSSGAGWRGFETRPAARPAPSAATAG